MLRFACIALLLAAATRVASADARSEMIAALVVHADLMPEPAALPGSLSVMHTTAMVPARAPGMGHAANQAAQQAQGQGQGQGQATALAHAAQDAAAAAEGQIRSQAAKARASHSHQH